MQLGVFAKTFPRAGLAEAFIAAKKYGFSCLQFNFSCVGLPTLPESIEAGLVRMIRSELNLHSLSMAAVSGTCNLIHPIAAQRQKDLANLEQLIRVAPVLGTRVVTLCTGTRDAENMWRRHPQNHSPSAWRDLLHSLDALLPAAQAAGVCLGIEPEPANVIDSAQKARKLLDEMKSPFLKIIFDAANLLEAQTLSTQDKILSEAVKLLSGDIVLAHAKDLALRPSENGGASCPDPDLIQVAAGQGCLDYGLYLSLLKQSGFTGPLVLHGLTEEEVPRAVTFLRGHLQEAADSTRSNRGHVQARKY